MFKNRAAAALIGIFALGAAFMALLSFTGTSYFCAIFLTVTVAGAVIGAAVRGRNIKYGNIIAVTAFAVAVFSFGMFRVSLDDVLQSTYSQYDGKEGYICMYASSVDIYSGSVVIEGTAGQGTETIPQGTSVRLTLNNYNDENICPGVMIEAQVHDYSSDLARNRRADGIELTAYGSLLAVKPPENWFYKFKYSVSNACGEVFSDTKSADIAKAVAIGDRSGLDSYDFAVFANSGISHILAISGLHINVLTMALYYFLRALGINRRVCGVVGSVFVVFYTALVGFTPGAVRAAVMMCFIMLWRVFMRRGDSVTSMFAALFVLLLFNPYSLFSTSLQLSFLCCLGMVVIGPYLRKYELFIDNKKIGAPLIKVFALTLLHAVTAPIFITVTATVFSFPVAYFNFNVISYISPLINIFAVPAFSAATVITLVSLVVYAVFPAAAAVIAKPAGRLFSAVYNVSDNLYSSGVGSVSIKTGFMYLLFIVSVFGIAAIVLSRRGRVKILCLSLAVFTAVFAASIFISRSSLLNTVSVEYSQNTPNYVFVSDKGVSAYVDLGGNGYDYETVFENGGTAIEHYAVILLDENASSRLDAMGGRLRIMRIYLPKPENSAEYRVFSRIKQLANRRNCDIIEYNGNLTVALDEHELFISDGAEVLAISGGSAHIGVFNGLDYGDYDYDVAVFTGNNALNFYNVEAGVYCVPDEAESLSFSKRHDCVIYGEAVRIDYSESDGEFKVYEP